MKEYRNVAGDMKIVLSEKKPILVFLKNGGYGMFGLSKDTLGNRCNNFIEGHDVFRLRAKRDYNNGVFGIMNIPEDLLSTNEN